MKFVTLSILIFFSAFIGCSLAHDVSEQVDELNERLREATASLEAMLARVEEQGWDKLLRRALASTQDNRVLDSEVTEIERYLFGEIQDLDEDPTSEQEEQDAIAEIEDLLQQDVTTQGWGHSISHAFHSVTHAVKKVAKKICDVSALDQEVKAVDQLLEAREQLQLASIQEMEDGIDNVDLGEDELADIMTFLDQADDQDWVELQQATDEDEGGDSAMGKLQALMDLSGKKAAQAEEVKLNREEVNEGATLAETLLNRLITKKLLKMLQERA